MYQVFGLQRVLYGFTVLCFGIFLARVILFHTGWADSFGDAWRVVSSSIALGTGLVVIVGQTALFPKLCRLPILRNYFPPIDGCWEAQLESNWVKIRNLMGQDGEPDSEPMKAEIQIISRLFFVRMNLVSNTRYSTSRTVFVSVSRDKQDSSIQLNYIYENRTPVPESTDCTIHNGAARVQIITDRVNQDEVWMEGTYWTDRKWVEGMNTAGKITFRKI
ncbi:Cap15 family cyclic dinucleotide receptor domain-containing protein [Pseudomonas tolaasii]